tara:strand:- start:2682 stop:3194 length:513 start_codon:yes stop_codon:yes gene_type:complete
MKRLASEVLRDLEIRVARLEKQSSTKIATEFAHGHAVMYFELVFDYDKAEEDGVNLSFRDFTRMENKALGNLSRILKVGYIGNEGHDSSDALICTLEHFADLEEVGEVISIVQRNTIGGEDQIDTNVKYFVAQGFTFYPTRKGVNGASYQIGGNGRHGDLEEYLEDRDVL